MSISLGGGVSSYHYIVASHCIFMDFSFYYAIKLVCTVIATFSK
uniref:Uncharacterized protein n=1 Tax=Lotus japonicus TaxID=34305 RepID=I3SWM6_LOTJA|nr:unknown [Lotus japonicus]